MKSQLQAPPIAKELAILLNDPAWQAGLRPQITQGPGMIAIGPVRRRTGQRDERLCVDHMEAVSLDPLPLGADRPPLDDSCVVYVEWAAAAGAAGWSAAELIERLSPTASQSLAAVVLHPGRNGGCTWEALLKEPGGRLRPIDHLRVVGPGMLKLDRGQPSPPALDAHEADRHSRTIGALGSPAFQRLRDLSVTVIGAGRLGGLFAAELAPLGVSQIRFVDPDVVEASNLNAMPLLGPRDVGRAKVRAVGRALSRLHPDLRVTCLARSVVSAEGAAALRAYPSDVLVSAVDSDDARAAVSLLARETLTPHLDIGTHVLRDAAGALQLNGDARMLLPGAGCTRCVGGYADNDQTLYELSAPPDVMRRGEPTLWNHSRAGSLVSLNSIVAGAGVQMLLDLVGGSLQASRWQRFAWQPGQGLQSDTAVVGAAEGCGVCQT